MTAREILTLLKLVRRSGDGWTAACPSHPDSTPSLSVRESKGRILLHCHAGCSAEAVVSALELQMSDLFIDPQKVQPIIVETYSYRDEQEKILFEVVRYKPKGFRQRRPDGSGGWKWKLNGVRRVLYNLPELIKSNLAVICEGEKDCETARKLGFVATCNPGGAGKWRPEYSEWLHGKRVAIVPDNDDAGRKHARDVARTLLGVSESIKVIEVPTGKDLSDWAEPAGSGTREGLLALIEAAPQLTADVVSARRPEECPQPTSGFRLATLGELMREPDETVSWLLEGILPAGGLSILAAKPKAGKSTLARCLALAVARGGEFLGRNVLQGPVLYLALEEKRTEVKKHFGDLGADGTEPIYIHCAAAPQNAIPELRADIMRLRPTLVIIDPILRMTRVKDANDYAQVSNALEPLMSLAREHGAHLLLVYHMGKGERPEASDAILGSTAFFAAVDTAVIMKRTEQCRTILSRQRYGDDLPETVLNFDPQSRAVSLGLVRSEVENRRVSESILEFLRTSDNPKTEEQIDEAVEGRNAAKRATLRQLVADEKIIRHGGGKRGDPYTYQSSYSCPSEVLGTRVQESQNVPQGPVNTGENLVPAPLDIEVIRGDKQKI